MECFLQFIGIPDPRPSLLTNRLDRIGIQRAHCCGFSGWQYVSHAHGSRASFFERGVVEKPIRVCVQDFMRKRRRRRRLDGQTVHVAPFNALQEDGQPVDVHGFLKAIPKRFLY